MTRTYLVYYYEEIWDVPYTVGTLGTELKILQVELDFDKVNYRNRFWAKAYEDVCRLAEYQFNDMHSTPSKYGPIYNVRMSMVPVRVEIAGYELMKKILR